MGLNQKAFFGGVFFGGPLFFLKKKKAKKREKTHKKILKRKFFKIKKGLGVSPQKILGMMRGGKKKKVPPFKSKRFFGVPFYLPPPQKQKTN